MTAGRVHLLSLSIPINGKRTMGKLGCRGEAGWALKINVVSSFPAGLHSLPQYIDLQRSN